MSVNVLERVVRRAGLAVRLTDLATGLAVRDAITVSTWPATRPDLASSTSTVTAKGIAGFTRLPGLGAYEDGSTAREEWFASPIQLPPLSFVVRVEDASGTHLRVVRQVVAPSATPVGIALPRSPAALTPPGSLTVVANVVTEAGDPTRWAVVELTVGSFVTGGVADDRGVVVIPVPRAVPPTGIGTPANGPVWAITVRVRYRPADQEDAPGATLEDPPTISSLLTQHPAHVDDNGALATSLQRDLTTSSSPLVLASRPPPSPSVLVVRPAP